jgi:putative chitinase
MCIANSVGFNGANHSTDVKLIQVLLNENLRRLTPYAPLVIDGRVGKRLLEMIGEFQRRVPEVQNPNRKIDPDSQALRELRAGMTGGLTEGKLQGIMIHANSTLITRYFRPLVSQMANSQINTPLRVAHFLAQVGHESGQLRYSEELASGQAYENRARLGNTHPGDGPRFKGRGLIQLTGRANYVAYGKARNRDFVNGNNYKLLASDTNLAVDVACWYWTTHRLNELADADDLNRITHKINRGYKGLPDRAANLKRAKFMLLR